MIFIGLFNKCKTLLLSVLSVYTAKRQPKINIKELYTRLPCATQGVINLISMVSFVFIVIPLFATVLFKIDMPKVCVKQKHKGNACLKKPKHIYPSIGALDVNSIEE